MIQHTQMIGMRDEMEKIAKVRLVRARRKIPYTSILHRSSPPGGRWRSVRKIKKDEGTFHSPEGLKAQTKSIRKDFWRGKGTERTYPDWPLQSTKRELGGEY